MEIKVGPKKNHRHNEIRFVLFRIALIEPKKYFCNMGKFFAPDFQIVFNKIKKITYYSREIKISPKKNHRHHEIRFVLFRIALIEPKKYFCTMGKFFAPDFQIVFNITYFSREIKVGP